MKMDFPALRNRISKTLADLVPVKDVEITAIVNRRIIIPEGQSWDDWFDGPGVSDDFMADQKQPEDQVRETL